MSRGRKVAIVGQGYVGLPLAMSAVKAGFKVTGIDVSKRIVEQLNQGRSHVEDVTDDELSRAIEFGLYGASNSGEAVSESDVCIICVPTPLSADGQPDLSFLESAVRLVAMHLKPNALLVSESTSYPGTVRDFVKPLVVSLRNDSGRELSFASAPERVDPRNEKWGMTNTPRLVSGVDETSTKHAMDFYSAICDTVIEVSKPEVAEMAKLLENTFRQVNIALVNQLVPFCKEIGIDIREVVDAAGSKPYGYMKFFPGAGVGGHCIPVDPLYLLWKAREVGVELPLVAKADELIEECRSMSSLDDRLVEPPAGSCIAILGVAYKSGVSDIRESPAAQVAQSLELNGFQVVWFDPFVDVFYEYDKWTGELLCGAILVTAQQGLPIEILQKSGVPILDCTGSLPKLPGFFHL